MKTGMTRLIKEADRRFAQVDQFDRERKYVLNPCYRLRRDSTRIVLYSFMPQLGILAGSHWFLHPRIAICLSLFDGSRTFDEIAAAVCYLFGKEDHCPGLEEAFAGAMKRLVEQCPKLLMQVPSEGYQNPFMPSPYDYIIDNRDVDLVAIRPKLDVPLTVNFHLNLECNRKCRYCYAPSHYREREHMPVGRYLELFDEAVDLGVVDVQFTGSDPLLNPNVVLLTEEVLHRGYNPFLSTKQYVSKKTARGFASAGLETFQISLDSVDAAMAAHLTGCADYLSLARSSIENLQSEGISVRIKAVATGFNIDGIPDLVRFAAEMKLESILIDGYGRSVFRHDDELFASNEAITRCLESIATLKHEYPDCDILSSLELYHEPDKEQRARNWRSRAACSAGRSQMTIMTDGAVIVCDQVPAEDAFIVGSVATSSLYEQWNSQAMNAFLYPERGSLNEPCRSCDDLRECCDTGGRCVRDVFVAFGTGTDGDPKCPVLDLPARY